KHHDSDQKTGPAHRNPGGDAQGRRDQRAANGINPEHTPWHVRRHEVFDELRAEEMQCAEDRQGESETQIAQGHDLIQAASLGDLGFRSPYSDEEKRDAGGAHPCCRAREFKKYGENGWVHRFPDSVQSFGLYYATAPSKAVA